MQNSTPFFCHNSGGRCALPDFFCPEIKTFRLKKENRTSHALRAAKLVNQLAALLCLHKVARLRRKRLRSGSLRAYRPCVWPRRPSVRVRSATPFFCPNSGQKNNEAARLHFTARSATSLKNAVFLHIFTKLPKPCL